MKSTLLADCSWLPLTTTPYRQVLVVRRHGDSEPADFCRRIRPWFCRPFRRRWLPSDLVLSPLATVHHYYNFHAILLQLAAVDCQPGWNFVRVRRSGNLCWNVGLSVLSVEY